MNVVNSFDDLDIQYLHHAVDISRLAPSSMTAFSVGCIIVDAMRSVVSKGYSREWGDDWHAEAVALKKAQRHLIDLSQCTLYSSLEPCSVRKSGRVPCCTLILDQCIARVVFGLREPAVFVDGKGAEHLLNAGIEVVELNSVGDAVRNINAHLFSGVPVVLSSDSQT